MEIKKYIGIGIITFLSYGYSYSQKNIIKVNYQLSHLEDSGVFSKNYRQHQLRIDAYKNYAAITTEPIERIQLGRYQKITWNRVKKIVGVFQPEIAFSYRNPGKSFGLNYTHYWGKRFIPRLGLIRYTNGRENIISNQDVSILNLGGFINLKQRWRLGLTFFQDIERLSNIVALLNVNYEYRKIYLHNYVNIGAHKNIGINLKMGWKNIFAVIGFNENIDFSGQQRKRFGVGYKIMFNTKKE